MKSGRKAFGKKASVWAERCGTPILRHQMYWSPFTKRNVKRHRKCKNYEYYIILVKRKSRFSINNMGAVEQARADMTSRMHKWRKGGVVCLAPVIRYRIGHRQKKKCFARQEIAKAIGAWSEAERWRRQKHSPKEKPLSHDGWVQDKGWKRRWIRRREIPIYIKLIETKISSKWLFCMSHLNILLYTCLFEEIYSSWNTPCTKEYHPFDKCRNHMVM